MNMTGIKKATDLTSLFIWAYEAVTGEMGNLKSKRVRNVQSYARQELMNEQVVGIIQWIIVQNDEALYFTHTDARLLHKDLTELAFGYDILISGLDYSLVIKRENLEDYTMILSVLV